MKIQAAVISPVGVKFVSLRLDESAMLKDLQAHVGGYIQLLPHPGGSEAPYMAYVNEEGLLRGLPANELARHVTMRLGFQEMEPDTLVGNVVILAQDEKSLSRQQCEEIRKLSAMDF